ncbi:MAG TPA: C-type lectin domain-containing protein [Kofleriaceae bacterium]|jgi:hypothetical protein|nr:C-type lectin domain-containing protein [Kofleriaceae bacterium]
MTLVLVRKSMWLAASSCLLVVACSFEHGTLMPQSDAPADTAKMDAPVARDARTCPPPPVATCRLFTCEGSTSCYYECGNGTAGGIRQNWAGARASCSNVNIGCLVTINDEVEQNCIKRETSPTYPTALWIGYYQADTTNEPLGGWTWACGQSSYTAPPWGSGLPMSEPNDPSGSENCAAMSDGGGWFDASCSSPLRFVCELP